LWSGHSASSIESVLIEILVGVLDAVEDTKVVVELEEVVDEKAVLLIEGEVDETGLVVGVMEVLALLGEDELMVDEVIEVEGLLV
jgi:hypothetical protein